MGNPVNFEYRKTKKGYIMEGKYDCASYPFPQRLTHSLSRRVVEPHREPEDSQAQVRQVCGQGAQQGGDQGRKEEG